MEYIGKDERQGGLDTVQNHHTVEDVKAIRKVIDKCELLVRINPINANSKQEIDDVITAGADIIMLPMWKTVNDVKTFLNFVDSRAKTMLLLETDEARLCLDEVLKLNGIDEIHIGLNDLSLSQGKRFLFELLVDGTVDEITSKIKSKGIPFGFGGVGRVYQNDLLPAQNILAEHYSKGSSMVILSRAFCNTSKTNNLDEIQQIFKQGIKENRQFENMLKSQSEEYFDKMHAQTKEIIKKIVSK
jgi:hypothetical protein